MELKSRIEGFAQANGNKFETANSAYKSYLNAGGEEDTPEAKPDFKTFLETAKQSGVLDKMLKAGGAEIKKKLGKEDEEPATTEKKGFKLSTPMIIGIVIGVAAIGTVIYFATKKKKVTA